MHWLRRLKQWLYALRLAGVRRVPWFGMLSALLSGPVPREVWRNRLRYGCFVCPLYSSVQMPGTTKRTDRLHLCKSAHPQMLGVGCHCAVNILALTANPYRKKGCFGRNLYEELGWPNHQDFRPWHRRLIDFLRGK